MKPINVLAFGEILWDIIDGKEHLGGAPFNFAAHTAQCGNEASIVSRLGKDQFGTRASEKAALLGVSTRFLEWDDVHATGTVDVTLRGGQPDYIIHPNVAYDFIQGVQVLDVLARGERFDVFYFGSLAQRQAVSATALHKILTSGKFNHIFYDVNLRKDCYNADIVRASLSSCTVFKLNHDEVPVIAKMLGMPVGSSQDLCDNLVTLYPKIKTILVTAAERGCFVYADKTMTHTPASPITLVDAVGAGDSFSAAFMHVYCQTGDPLKAARIANAVGGFVAANAGPIPSYSPEIRKMLGNL